MHIRALILQEEKMSERFEIFRLCVS